MNPKLVESILFLIGSFITLICGIYFIIAMINTDVEFLTPSVIGLIITPFFASAICALITYEESKK